VAKLHKISVTGAAGTIVTADKITLYKEMQQRDLAALTGSLTNLNNDRGAPMHNPCTATAEANTVLINDGASAGEAAPKCFAR
jgi:hypothetical protein